MASITTVTTLIGTEESFATRQVQTLVGKFERMQKEKLRSPSKLPELLRQESVPSHRIFVHIYSFVADESDTPAR